METHKCKLCSRSFSNGRALGGHMKAHLASLPLPPPEKLAGDPPPTASSSSDEEKPLVYEPPENPRKSLRISDPGSGSAIVVQDGESETESRNPTRKRSKRHRRSRVPAGESPASSVSYTSPEEDVAMCLMMLSRDKWAKKRDREEREEERESKPFVMRRKKRCEKCMKQFRSYRALFSHEKICRREDEEEEEAESFENGGNRRIFKCPFCFRLFGSGQALGGHKRSHLLSSIISATVTVKASESLKLETSLIDLNLPAPVEEDDYSVVSDA